MDALGQSFAGSSALLKHEVAYVLGQMLQELAIPFLRCLLAPIQICKALSQLAPLLFASSTCRPIAGLINHS